ncbi:nucleoside 2-deoxyribosyltransferase [Dactylosporangium sucinum]|uniref:Nucleoside 2-deoxyribosyltransferase n=1 Tax=Dactylosporangium sucinum TaxID=1424081 RepID=A0A917WHV5_9ACTN|nr:nucleoside 2-deoxyribosyltransferase [Dactylosporangium sucinum]GGM05212.1 hypothetical protein GCM10007977_002950 [Dactylosporangium sucinum]
MEAARPQPSVYFARAVDFVDPTEVAMSSARAREALARLGLRLVDPVEHEAGADLPGLTGSAHAAAIVELDLALLRRSDAMLVDMTIPARNYIGCVAELVYAHQWRIPAVVYVGSTGYEQRPWLRYHATHVCRSQDEAVAILRDVLIGTAALPAGRTPE